MNKTSSRAIVYCIDDNPNCLFQLYDSIHSVRKILGDIDIIILTNRPEIKLDTKQNVRILDVSKIVEETGLSQTGVSWRGSDCPPMMFMRLAIPLVDELRHYEKILYLDTDTEIFDRDFLNIFDFDKEDKEITAVRDIIMSPVKIDRRMVTVEHAIRHLRFDYYNRSRELHKYYYYVNSGVLVFNMHRFKDKEAYLKRFKSIVELIRKSLPRYPDQDILNLCYQICGIGDRAYNYWFSDRIPCHLAHYIGRHRKLSNIYPPESSYRPEKVLYSIPSEEFGLFSGKADSISLLIPEEYRDITQKIVDNLSSEIQIKQDIRKKITPITIDLKDDQFFNRSLYEAIRKSYDSGNERTFFIYGGIFSQNTSRRLDRLMKEFPINSDLVILDIPSDEQEKPVKYERIGFEAAKESLRCFDLISLSRRFMRIYLRKYESLQDDQMKMDDWILRTSRIYRTV